MKILISTVDLSIKGGVASYYRGIKPFLGKDVDFFTVGTRLKGLAVFGTLSRFLQDYQLFKKVLSSQKYDLVTINPSFGYKALIRDGINLIYCKKCKKKVMVFMRGWDQATERIISLFFLFLFRYVYFKADAFIVLGSEFKKKLETMGYKGPIFIETTTVAEDTFDDNINVNSSQLYEADRSSFHILFLSRMKRGKGINETLNAYHILKSKYQNVSLVMAGDGGKLHAAKMRAIELGLTDVDFPGYVNGKEKRIILNHADVFCFPTSYGEGMPNSILEAMAYGLPIVTRPVGGLKDFFEDGKMGFITESNDPTVFAGLLERLLLNPELKKEMGDYNQKYAFEHFRASIVAKRLLKICEGVVATHYDPLPIPWTV